MGLDSVFGIITELFLAVILPSSLPYKWDFVRLSLGAYIRFVINASSYFIDLALFTFRTITLVNKEIENLSATGNDISPRLKAVFTGLVIMLTIQFAWPRLVHIAFFLTCSYYPWTVTSAVIGFMFFDTKLLAFMTRKPAAEEHDSVKPRISSRYTAWAYFMPKAEHGSTTAQTSDNDISVQRRSITTNVGGKKIEQELPAFPEKRRGQELESSISSEEQISLDSLNITESSLSPLMMDNESCYYPQRPSIGQFLTEASLDVQSAMPLEPLEIDTPRNFSLRHPYSVMENWTDEDTPQQAAAFTFAASTPKVTMKSLPNVSSKLSTEISTRCAPASVSQPRSLKTTYRKGYCGRCWKMKPCRHSSNLQSLRLARTTRSGKVYGPPSHITPLHEYTRDYGL